MGLVEADADQVTPANPDSLGQPTHPGALVSVDCVEGVVAAGEGANLDHNRGGLVKSNDVDFATGDNHVTGDYLQAFSVQEEASKELTKLTGSQPR
jgi:hypothetical protein